MTQRQEFDVAEMSLSSYAISLLKDSPFIAIPVFPSRAFRHNSIYVNTAGPVKTPGDLRGAVVGIPEYQVTAAVWVRGILAEMHGVPVESVHYRIGGLHHPGRVEKIKLDLPPEVDYQQIADTATLNEMLVSGQIDALYTPRTPDSFIEGRPEVARLFADPKTAESAYFQDTGVFPIMHTIVIRRELYDRHRWIAGSLFKAFEASKQLVLDRLNQSAAFAHMLPWLYANVEEARSALGDDFWPYGIDRNRATLDTFLRYSHEQGLTDRQLEVGELFAPETSDFVII